MPPPVLYTSIVRNDSGYYLTNSSGDRFPIPEGANEVGPVNFYDAANGICVFSSMLTLVSQAPETPTSQAQRLALAEQRNTEREFKKNTDQALGKAWASVRAMNPATGCLHNSRYEDAAASQTKADRKAQKEQWPAELREQRSKHNVDRVIRDLLDLRKNLVVREEDGKSYYKASTLPDQCIAFQPTLDRAHNVANALQTTERKYNYVALRTKQQLNAIYQATLPLRNDLKCADHVNTYRDQFRDDYLINRDNPDDVIVVSQSAASMPNIKDLPEKPIGSATR